LRNSRSRQRPVNEPRVTKDMSAYLSSFGLRGPGRQAWYRAGEEVAGLHAMTPHVLAADLLLVNGRVLTMDARDAVRAVDHRAW
jgi:hypothetical protein